MTKHILMIHGVGCGGDAWDDMVPHFEAAGWTCRAPTLFPDQRTVSDPPDTLPDLRFEDYIEEASRWAREITERSGSRPVVMGHSMGGLLAQKLAERGDIAAGVLVTPAQPKDCNVTDLRIYRTFWNIIKHGIKRAKTMSHKVGKKGLAYGVWNRTPKARHDALYAQARFDSGGVYNDMLEGIELDERKIDVPTLTICGAKDRATVPEGPCGSSVTSCSAQRCRATIRSIPTARTGSSESRGLRRFAQISWPGSSRPCRSRACEHHCSRARSSLGLSAAAQEGNR